MGVILLIIGVVLVIISYPVDTGIYTVHESTWEKLLFWLPLIGAALAIAGIVLI